MIQINLNGRWQQIDRIDPNTTLLHYLRHHAALTDSKEGCAGGDCGACSVLLGQQQADGSIRYRHINSCIALLAQAHNGYIVTASALATLHDSDGLHPAQRALVEQHGSQCGFCTPGFAVALAALYENHSGRAADKAQVHTAISGNLCRCTGYRPIVEAGLSMHQYAAHAGQTATPAPPPAADCAELSHNGRTLLIPQNEAQLQQALRRYPDAVLWAGGTDLGLTLTQQFKQYDTIICLHQVAELLQTASNKHSIDIGAAVCYQDAETLLHEHFPAFGALMHRFASQPIRHLGTIGGNIANASPIGDTPPVLLALEAEVEIVEVLSDGRRHHTIALADFFLDYKQTRLPKAAYIRNIRIPQLQAGEALHVYKVSKRPEDDISAVLFAAKMRIISGRIQAARIAYGGMAAIPKLAVRTAAALVDKPFEIENLQQAANHLPDEFSPMSDVRAGAAYRMQVAQNLLLKPLLANETAEAV
ncbi:xanthine dehydrogenase small subunit [Uruburuella testudinis]|uniref:Xanthine dehydrogenase small subunit n=1 Tax=Uruburuella testudinis TaxID=1282863 RepID=A0ABY4DR72_9NEIS|nr:xanthine dehydrogenase small subunit [Uruburuella testudinis]UOO81224.1 xanthine dehydrogenase small subunit [Uruburuella testudinis]